MPCADLGLVLVRARGVDVAVADLERVADALGRVLAGDQPRAEAEPRDPRALDRRARSRRRVRLLIPTELPARAPPHTPAALLPLRPPRAISSAGRAPARQAGGHWFEPSIAHRKSLRVAGFSRCYCPQHGRRISARPWRRKIAAVLERDGHRRRLRLPGCTGVATTADHIRRARDGGGDELSSLRASCEACNRRRG